MRTRNVKKNMAGAKCEIKLRDDKLPGYKCYYTGGSTSSNSKRPFVFSLEPYVFAEDL